MLRKWMILLFAVSISSAQYRILILMDELQTDHLRAYGIAYRALRDGVEVEWLLNYRGGSFLIDYDARIEELSRLRGVKYTLLSASDVADIYSTIETSNMNRVLLEKAPKIAVYVPPYKEPWDDAVALALQYAEIPFDRLYDDDILEGKLAEYDWLHLHHEDFTGQYGKFYLSYRNADWYRKTVEVDEETAKRWKFEKVPKLKLAVAQMIREYVKAGGFLFAMCSAPATLDIALSAHRTDIVGEVYDGDPQDPDAQSKLDFSVTFAFEDFVVSKNPLEYEHSDIDVTKSAVLRGKDTYFSLFDFSAKYDPVPTILTQDHTKIIREFLGQDTGFRKEKLKNRVIIMGEVKGTEEAKYIYGSLGEGFFSFLGGHDPEDYQHLVGDPPTDLRLHKTSPGYRLILNNVLFPAAQRRKLKT